MRQESKELLLLFVDGAVMVLVLYLSGVSFDIYGYGLVLAAAISFFFYLQKFVKYYKKQSYLTTQFDSLCSGISEFMEAEGGLEDIYLSIARQMRSVNARQAGDYAAQKKDMTDYFTMWMHQIKTPIAALHLLLQSGFKTGEVPVQDMENELFKVEEYVGMVMTYLHTEDGSSDYVIANYFLDDIVRQAIRKYAKIFIQKKIQLDMEEMHTVILTDEKWTAFVIGQVLSNALKYTKSGSIHIYLEHNKRLVVEDTGMGIAPEDLPRIFEKGYTGYNGRMDKKSTGIGLYLCRRIFKRLGHKINAQSKMGKGTKIYMDFL